MYKSYSYLNRKSSRKNGYDSIIVILTIIMIFIIPALFTSEEKEEEVIINNINPTIKVYFVKESIIKEVELEEYIKGVVAAEMPVSFENEALKAQAVAARTYAYSRMLGIYGSSTNHFGADICTDYRHCQAYISESDFKSQFEGDLKNTYWDKVSMAVENTKNIIMTYDNKVINPLYHANSGGITEDIESVWSTTSVPYLKSVYSKGEDEYSSFKKRVVITKEAFIKKVMEYYPDLMLDEHIDKSIKVKNFTSSNRVMEIRVGNTLIDGVKFREIFSLNSTNFEIELEEEKVMITTNGYGHGVGMSQCGANKMAKDGDSFYDILSYYYSGIEFDEIKNK